MTTSYRTVVLHIPPTPLGLLPERWAIEHYCNLCRERVTPEQLIAHAQGHDHAEALGERADRQRPHPPMSPHPITLRYDPHVTTCAGPGCTNTIAPHAHGRPARYCSTACRVRAHRQRQHLPVAPVTVEIDIGSSSSRGRPPERAWLVRLRRGDRTVIVAIGLRRNAADLLAEQLTDILADPHNQQQPSSTRTPIPNAPTTTTDHRRR